MAVKVPANATKAVAKTVYVALLRGINVGGKNAMRMQDLAAIFAAAGCEDVRTYIQSGNVIFRATAAQARSLPAEVSRRVEAAAGLRVPVVLRSAVEIDEIRRNYPFPGPPEKTAHVFFLADAPAAAAVAALDP